MKKLGKRRSPSFGRSPRIERQKQSIFQYSSNRSQSDRAERQEGSMDESPKKAKNPFKNYLYRLILAGILVCALLTSFLTSSPTVTLADNQQSLRDLKAYQEVADRSSNGWRSFSKLTLERQKIANQISSQYPEITKVDVSTPLFSRAANIKISVARPAVILNAQNGKYVLDQRGIALFDIDKNKPGFKTESLSQVDDQTGASIDLGKPALTSSQVNFITEVKRQSEAKKIKVNSITLTGGGGELHIKHGDLPYFVKYSLYEDPRKSFGTFEATREHMAKNNIKPAEYIDVRIPERAYIK